MRKIQGERKTWDLIDSKINVSNVWVPTDAKLKNWLMRKAQVKSISEGEFNVKKIQI